MVPARTSKRPVLPKKPGSMPNGMSRRSISSSSSSRIKRSAMETSRACRVRIFSVISEYRAASTRAEAVLVTGNDTVPVFGRVKYARRAFSFGVYSARVSTARSIRDLASAISGTADDLRHGVTSVWRSSFSVTGKSSTIPASCRAPTIASRTAV